MHFPSLAIVKVLLKVLPLDKELIKVWPSLQKDSSEFAIGQSIIQSLAIG